MTQTADVDETIRRSVKALMVGRGQTVEDIAPAVGMAVSTLYRRLAGRGEKQAFSGGETARLALYFGVPVTDLFDGLGGRVLAQRMHVPDIAEFLGGAADDDGTTRRYWKTRSGRVERPLMVPAA